MGDVLSGVIAALLAKGLPIAVAARLGVILHSHAADIMSSKVVKLACWRVTLSNLFDVPSKHQRTEQSFFSSFAFKKRQKSDVGHEKFEEIFLKNRTNWVRLALF